jgi:subtilisin family serine protease
MKTPFRTVILFALLLFVSIQFPEIGSASGLQPGSEAYWWSNQGEESIIEPGLRETLSTSQPDDMISVILTLRDQIDTSKIGGPDRGARLEALVTALQAKAKGTQKPLVNLLSDWQVEKLVASYTSFWVFNGLAVTATPGVINTLAEHPLVLRITPDETAFELSVNYSSPVEANISLVDAPALWDLGYRGQGVVVATMDTGVYLNHPDLIGQWRGGSNSWFDPYGEHPTTPSDTSGHGTQTLGIILGGDAGGTIVGVAPDAQWIAVKIFNDAGQATTAEIHAGFQWLLDPDGDPGTADAPHVVNNSWTFQSPGCNLEFQLDLQALRTAGILPVFSAGNAGPFSFTSMSPANNPEAFAVGAVDNLDQIYYYSSRGPSSCGEPETIFPEIVAPGVSVRTTERYGLYTQATGTSLAAPHVSGALALLLSAFSDATASQQEGALMNGAVDLGYLGPDNSFGYGRLNILEAYQILNNGGWATATPIPTPTATPEPPTPTPTVDLTVNLALNQPVWASSFQDDAHNGDMAVDGSPDTFWKSKKAVGKKVSPNEWIKVDLGSSVTINQVILEWDANYAQAYTLQVSEDDQNWSTIFNTTNGDGGSDPISLNAVSGRYILMESSAWSDGSLRTWLREFQVFGSSGNPLPTDTPTPTPTPTPTSGVLDPVHVGDLDGSSNPETRNRWSAAVTITIHDQSEFPVANATVSGSWSGAASNNASCTTDSNGQCTVSAANLKTRDSAVTFSLSDISGTSMLYQPVYNHDPDGDSDGYAITVTSP